MHRSQAHSAGWLEGTVMTFVVPRIHVALIFSPLQNDERSRGDRVPDLFLEEIVFRWACRS
jgi:hypothetical protein